MLFIKTFFPRQQRCRFQTGIEQILTGSASIEKIFANRQIFFLQRKKNNAMKNFAEKKFAQKRRIGDFFAEEELHLEN